MELVGPGKLQDRRYPEVDQLKAETNNNKEVYGKERDKLKAKKDKFDKKGKKMKGVKHYKRDGSEHKGATHKMPDGELHTNKTHTKTSVRLYHLKDLSKAVQTKLKKRK